MGAEFLHIFEINFFKCPPSSECLKENNQFVVFFFNRLLLHLRVLASWSSANHFSPSFAVERVTMRHKDSVSRQGRPTIHESVPDKVKDAKLRPERPYRVPVAKRCLIDLDRAETKKIRHVIEILPFGRSSSRHVAADIIKIVERFLAS